MAERVRQDFLHAWGGYKQYAWGHDELQPLTKSYRDWYAPTKGTKGPAAGEPGSASLLMTPVDALDTMVLMGLNDEADKARELIDSRLSFDKDIYVKNFEITIRLLGGLLSSYQLTGDKHLLDLANDLGTRLLPAFNSPTGMPYVFVNLKTGATKGVESNPGGDRFAADRVRHAEQTDRQAGVLRQGQARAARSLRSPLANRTGRLQY